MPDKTEHDSDVVVIGGGPAGSTVATLLARQGWRVTLLEKSSHPRFHIGESLLPMNLPILERLGVLQQVREIGVYKPAADFPSDLGTCSSFSFARALGAVRDHAFQVKRSEFDELLFRHATAAGVDTVEQCEVLKVEAQIDGSTVLKTRSAGQESNISTRYLVDASGRDTLLGRQLGIKQAHRRHRSAAMFAHFRGVSRRAGLQGGNISIYRLARGWAWMIPLRDDVMSVGAVCDPEHFRQRDGSLTDFLVESVHFHPEARERMRAAQCVSEPEATGNYSYACNRIAGRGWIMAGDAYAFVDPIFSSGVYLAMSGAEQAASVVDAALRHPAREASLQRAYRRRVDHGLRTFSWFIERFTSPVMRELFEHPSNVWKLEQAVIAMLAGDVFDNRAVRWRLQVFRLVYAVTAWRLGRRKPAPARAGTPA